MRVGEQKCVLILAVKPEGKRQLEDIGVDGRVIL
jgi:hypothetical protein